MNVVPGVCEVPQQPVVLLDLPEPLHTGSECMYWESGKMVGTEKPCLALMLVNTNDTCDPTRCPIRGLDVCRVLTE